MASPRLESNLSAQLFQAHSQFLSGISMNGDLTSVVSLWESIERTVLTRQRAGSLGSMEAEQARATAQQLLLLGSTVIRLQVESEDTIGGLAFDMKRLLRIDNGKIRGDIPVHQPNLTGVTTHVKCQSARSQDASRFMSDTAISAEALDHLDPVRTWLLQNLHHPFPTPAEKTHLAQISSRPRANIETDLTNYRRRSGWTEFKNKYCKGDTNKARDIIWKWMNGGKVSSDMEKDLENMKGYVERREASKVGGWIETVCPPSFFPSSSSFPWIKLM